MEQKKIKKTLYKITTPIIGGLIALPIILTSVIGGINNESNNPETYSELDLDTKLWKEFEYTDMPSWIWETEHDNDPTGEQAWGGSIGTDDKDNDIANKNRKEVLNLHFSDGEDKDNGPFNIFDDMGEDSIDPSSIEIKYVFPKMQKMHIPVQTPKYTYFEDTNDNYGLSIQIVGSWLVNETSFTPYEYRFDLKDNYKPGGGGVGTGGNNYSIIPLPIQKAGKDDPVAPGAKVIFSQTEDYDWNNSVLGEPYYWVLDSTNINEDINKLVFNNDAIPGNPINPIIDSGFACNDQSGAWFASCMLNTNKDANGKNLNPLSFLYELPIYSLKAESYNGLKQVDIEMSSRASNSVQSRFKSFSPTLNFGEEYYIFWKEGYNIAERISLGKPKPAAPLSDKDKSVLIVLSSLSAAVVLIGASIPLINIMIEKFKLAK